MKIKYPLLMGLAACAAAALLLTGPVAASGDRYEGHEYGEHDERGGNDPGQTRASRHGAAPKGGGFDPLYAKECGACHMAYPPGALPARSWERMMAGLGDHFGDDAELEPNETVALTAYLVANSAEHSRGEMREMTKRTKKSETPQKITELRHFKKEHREVPSRVFRDNPELKLSNCEACHTKAAQNSYRERDIDIPGFGRWDD